MLDVNEEGCCEYVTLRRFGLSDDVQPPDLPAAAAAATHCGAGRARDANRWAARQQQGGAAKAKDEAARHKLSFAIRRMEVPVLWRSMLFWRTVARCDWPERRPTRTGSASESVLAHHRALPTSCGPRQAAGGWEERRAGGRASGDGRGMATYDVESLWRCQLDPPTLLQSTPLCLSHNPLCPQQRHRPIHTRASWNWPYRHRIAQSLTASSREAPSNQPSLDPGANSSTTDGACLDSKMQLRCL